jgi:hypothetical protein
VLDYDFNEDTGTVAHDLSSNGYNAALSSSSMWTQGPTPPEAVSSNFAVGVSSGQEINVGSKLAFDRNQPWTIMTSIDVAQKPTTAAVILSNLSGSAHSGYQLWIDPQGHLRVRLISNYAAGNYIELQSSVVVTDGKWHDIAVSYDGSGSASGVKIYLDGVQDVATKTLANALTGSIVSAGPLTLGNQTGYLTTYELNGSLDQFSISNEVRSAAYIAQYSKPGFAAPPVDANTVLDYNFNEDTGAVAHDLSSDGYNATLSSSSMWTQGPAAPEMVTYTPQAGFVGTDSFSYTETDGTGTATGRATVTVTSPLSVAGTNTIAASTDQSSGNPDLDRTMGSLVNAMASFGAPSSTLSAPLEGVGAASQPLEPAVVSPHPIHSGIG